jgi:hypothetical protein
MQTGGCCPGHAWCHEGRATSGPTFAGQASADGITPFVTRFSRDPQSSIRKEIVPMRYPRYRAICLSPLLCLSVLLFTPFAARATSIRHGALNTQSAYFQAIDGYVASQTEAMHIPGVALGIVPGTEVVHVQGFGVANPAGQPMTARAVAAPARTALWATRLAGVRCGWHRRRPGRRSAVGPVPAMLGEQLAARRPTPTTWRVVYRRH